MKTKKISLVFFIGIVLGILIFKGGEVVGRTAVQTIQSNKDDTVKIQTILENNCNCDTIEKGIHATGIQFSKSDGFSTEKVDFTLTNCEYNNLKEEGNRIAQLLQKEGMSDYNLITLDFISNDKQETLNIRDGKIQ